MFKQRKKIRTRATSCKSVKHVFPKNNRKCLCGNYYLNNGRILRSKGDYFVAGTTADFRYKGERPTRRAAKSKLKQMLRK